MSRSRPLKRRGPKERKPLKSSEEVRFSFRSKCYFLTYKGTTDSGQKIRKEDLTRFLTVENPNDRKNFPVKYLVCQQTYDSGQIHFHAILIFDRLKKIEKPSHYDYLGIHPNVQRMRNLRAALSYVYKQDPSPLTNMDVRKEMLIARSNNGVSFYHLLKQHMVKDPFNFNPITFAAANDLDSEIIKTNYSKAIGLMKLIQAQYCNQLLIKKPGFKYIDRALIEEKLTSSELRTYDSWPGYRSIVDHLNVMNSRRGFRQQKTKNLLITGPPSVGKTALIWQRDPSPGRTSVVNHLPVYPMGMKDWFPEYKSDVYACIFWNEAKLTSYSFDVILQLLDGSPVTLPSKGGGNKKVDNPLIVMTSNMTLSQMIHQKFKSNKQYLELAKRNLAERIQNVVIPEGHDLFLLQKLMVSNATDQTTDLSVMKTL